MTVFVVTTENDRCQEIEGVFATHTRAKQFIDATPHLDEPDIIGYDLDERLNSMDEGWGGYTITAAPDGRITNIERTTYQGPRDAPPRWVKLVGFGPRSDHYQITMNAKSIQHALEQIPAEGCPSELWEREFGPEATR